MKQPQFPATLTVTKLHEVDSLIMANEIVNRYNAFESLITEVERLQDENASLSFYNLFYKIGGIACIIVLTALYLTK